MNKILDITSRDNPLYKQTKKLLGKKTRDGLGRYLIEGNNLMEEALNYEAPILYIILRNDYDIQNSRVFQRKQIPGQINIYMLESHLFDDLADTITSQGIIGVVEKPETKSFPTDGNIVVFDRLQDPGNIGSIIRTAEAAGYVGVGILKGTGDVFSPKVVRGAAGSLFRMPILFFESREDFLASPAAKERRLVASSLKAKRYYYQEDISRRIALIIGNEGQGIDPLLEEQCDISIKIPMKGNMDSLNVAVAAGILMYESMRNKG